MRMFESCGATVVPLAFTKVYHALKSAEIDGQENPLTFIDTSKFYEAQKYLSLSNHICFPSFVIVSEERFAAFPEDMREPLKSTAEEMQDRVRDTAGPLEQNLVQKLGQGMAVNEVDPLSFTS